MEALRRLIYWSLLVFHRCFIFQLLCWPNLSICISCTIVDISITIPWSLLRSSSTQTNLIFYYGLMYFCGFQVSLIYRQNFPIYTFHICCNFVSILYIVYIRTKVTFTKFCHLWMCEWCNGEEIEIGNQRADIQCESRSLY